MANDLICEVAPSGRSLCRQCGRTIGKGEKRARFKGHYAHGFVYCEQCLNTFIDVWQSVKGYAEQVKDALQESINPSIKVRKLNME